MTGLQVLVIDDDEHARDLVQTVLQSAGALVTAATAADALRAALTADVILCDLSAAEAAGAGFVDQLRHPHAPGERSVPAIALVSHDRNFAARARAAGFQRSLAKPVDESELRSLVRGLAIR